MADSGESNLREFSRVDAVIPLEVRLVSPEEHRNLRSFIVGEAVLPEYPIPPEVDDIILSEWLKMLNSKLDAIIGAISEKYDKVAVTSQKLVNISGGGLGFDSPVKYEVGDILEMKLMLPIIPSYTLYVYGEVVTSRAERGNYHTALKFITIDDEVRDHIVKFVFKTQRDMIRKKRK
ncbi:MAG TPA: PilZ domain-containing protein [Dissulfurispiraceae bacterium]|nr:PilZ domain-containing protein [Dissulfurispiraceae bacterium]